MLTFTITAEQRHRAQRRAAELDLVHSDHPGQFPYVWDNRQNSVKRWCDYRSGQNKIGTIYFEAVGGKDGELTDAVQCSTEITYHSITDPATHLAKIDDLQEHKWLAELFLAELLATPTHRLASNRNVPGSDTPGALRRRGWSSLL
jgi:hypothetical protein